MLKYDKNTIMSSCKFVKDVCILESVDSTNSVAKRMAAEGAPEGTLIISHIQTAGKGSNGRIWYSGENQISMSIILRPSLKKDSMPLLTLITGLAVNEAIKEITGLDTGIKYPNDILASGKKLCGILAESVMEERPYVVLGIGINVDNERFPDEISETATSLALQGVNTSAVNELIAAIFNIFDRYYKKLL